VFGCVFTLLRLELYGYDCHDEIYVHMYGYMSNGLLCMRDMIHK